MNNSQEITAKQDEIYRNALAAFILQSRKTIEEQRQLYQDYVSRNFAKMEGDNQGGYNITQKGQSTLNIRQPSTLTQSTIQLR